MRRFIFMILVMANICTYAIDRINLLDHNELHVEADRILHLPGLGLGINCGEDSIMLLDNPELAFIRWIEPNACRSLVRCGKLFYGAQGDSIVQIATKESSGKLIGRLDNCQFSLDIASDSTFFAVTSDPDFSCVYEINPTSGYCNPIFSVKAPLYKISRFGERLIALVDDTVLITDEDGIVEPFYQSPNITDIALTPIGVVLATSEGLRWMTTPTSGALLLDTPVSNLWWDDADVLYYRTSKGDLCAIVGLIEAYLSLSKPN